MRKTLDLLAVVSDLHCGSEVGLAPPETKLRSGNVIGFGENKHQQWLWDRFEEGGDKLLKIAGTDPFVLLVNGDATEGCHHHNNDELVAATIEIHTEMAAQCLRRLAQKAARRIVVRGTQCHTREMEDVLADKIGADPRSAPDKFLFEMRGCLVDAAHHVGVTSRAYLEASALSINMGNARLNYLRAGQRVPRVFLRAHRHCGGYFSDGTGLMAVTGGWQFKTRHGHKVVTDSIPSPTMLMLDWRDKPSDSLPRIHEIKFHEPQQKIIKL